MPSATPRCFSAGIGGSAAACTAAPFPVGVADPPSASAPIGCDRSSAAGAAGPGPPAPPAAPPPASPAQASATAPARPRTRRARAGRPPDPIPFGDFGTDAPPPPPAEDGGLVAGGSEPFEGSELIRGQAAMQEL